MDYFTERRYDRTLGRDILKSFGSNLKFSKRVIRGGDGQFESFTAPMVDLGMYKLEILNTDKIIPKESFMDVYLEKI